MLFATRKVDVEVAIVRDAEHRIFLAYNPNWRGYALPMKKRQDTDAYHHGAPVLRAMRELVDFSLEEVTPIALPSLPITEVSERTGKKTIYTYHPYELSLPQQPRGGHFASRQGFLSYNDIMKEDSLVSKTSQLILEAIIEEQEIGIAVIVRGYGDNRELLVVNYPRYGRFLPACRVREPSQNARDAARAAVRDDLKLGYVVPIQSSDILQVAAIQESRRWDQMRTTRFTLCRVSLPDEQLKTLNQPNADYEWIHENDLGQLIEGRSEKEIEDDGYSPTFALIYPELKQLLA